jgi:hypothetical protein
MINVTTMMHMNRAMRPIIMAKRIGTISSLLDGVFIVFVDACMSLEVCIVVDLVVCCVGVISSSCFCVVSGSSDLCGDLDSSVGIADTMGSFGVELQVLSDVHTIFSGWFSFVHTTEHMIGLGEHPVPTSCIIAHVRIMQSTVMCDNDVSGDVLSLVQLSQCTIDNISVDSMHFVLLLTVQFNEL